MFILHFKTVLDTFLQKILELTCCGFEFEFEKSVEVFYRVKQQKNVLTATQIYFNFLPKIDVQIVVKTTILIELNGINIAAITGANCPVMAKYKPILL